MWHVQFKTALGVTDKTFPDMRSAVQAGREHCHRQDNTADVFHGSTLVQRYWLDGNGALRRTICA